jgi:hypothetical protein
MVIKETSKKKNNIQKKKLLNLNLPGNQKHCFHLLDEQSKYFRYTDKYFNAK